MDGSTNRLVIFDVDGTLTRTTGVDDECFVEAVRRVLGVEVVDTDWGNYVHSTDDGLTVEVCERGLGRRPSAAEVERVRSEFLGLLGERIGREPERCRAVEGAAGLMGALRGRPGWRVGVASGAWAGSAAIKLRAAGVDVLGLPATYSFAHPGGEPVRREEIIAATMRAMGAGDDALGRTVYVGDGVWDARAARRLGVGFVGVRCDGRRERLVAEGVERIVHGYGDVEAFVAMVEGACRAR